VFYLRKMGGAIGSFATAGARFSSPILPFSSLPALEIAMSVPPGWRYDARLLRSISAALAPRFASHPTLHGCPCAPMGISNFWRFLPKYGKEAQRLVRKAGSVWLHRALLPEFKEAVPVDNVYRRFVEVESRPGGHLDQGQMLTGKWYAPAAFPAFLADLRERPGRPALQLLSCVYTCEALLRLANAGATQERAPASARIACTTSSGRGIT